MEAALLGRLINPYTQNSLDNLFSRTVVARPKDAVPGLPGTADRADLGAAAASPTQVLNQEILDSLDKVLSANGASGLDRNVDTDTYSPEKVAERILGFIESVVGQEPDEGKRSELLDQARAGVEKGFAEARDILEGLGVLNGDVAGNVDRTYELIQGGLERLASNGSDDDGDGDEHIESEEGSSAAAATQAGFVASSYSTTQTTSLIVNTLEGDRVTIDITKQATTSRTEIAGAAGSGGFSSVQSSREASVSFNFNVEGDLNEDEQKAIDNLIKRIDKVSDKFFDSNVQAAFNKASNLEFNSEELAGFSLNLSNTQTFRAVAAYQQSQPASAEPETASLGDAAALGGEVRGLIDEAAATTPLAEPARDVANIFNALTSERASAFGFDALKNDAMSALQDLVGRIVDSYKVDREDAHAEEHGEQNDNEVEEAA